MSKVPMLSADRARDATAARLHVGWLDLRPDERQNFQLNRWLAYGGERWLADVRPVLASRQSYDA